MNNEPHEKRRLIVSDIDATVATLTIITYAMASILDIRYRAPHDILGQVVRRTTLF